ncbi:MAG: FecR domain-containing protein [Acidocella sp.]|nr:FecR domain-containing protein [Acidocella sp.]MDR3736680.1 FecR domain-containing protein [Acidobacteriaceae bacterium]
MSRTRFSLRRVLAFTTALGLAMPANAQDSSYTAPPSRVGQITGIAGSVSYNGAGSNGQWVTASNNYPLTSGDSLFTQGGGEASIAIDSSRITLGPNTELQVTRLDDSDFTATENQGEIFLNLTALRHGQDFNINTPGGEVSIDAPGQYEVLAGDTNTPAEVQVFRGQAETGGVTVSAGQAAYLTGNGQPELTQAQRDEFANHVMAELTPPPPPYVPPAVTQMTGVNELSSYGSWDQSPQYGAIWYPNVAAGWAPYHYGHWAYVAPWGWTWVEDEPWGFAPFHYGRWTQIYGRWGWVPCGYADGGYVAPPVYAPALVSFFGLGLAAGITIEALSRGDIGWVPLGPGEAYYPHYHTNQDYLRRINRFDMRDPGRVDFQHPPTFGNYANRGAALYGPASGISHGEQAGHYAKPVPYEMFGQARPVGQQFPEAVRPQFTPHSAPAPTPGFHQQQGFTPQPQMQPLPGQHGTPQQFHQQTPGGFAPQGQQQFHQQQMPQVITPQEQQQHTQQQFHPEQPQGIQQQPFHQQQTPQALAPQEQQQHTQPQFHPQQPQGFQQQPFHQQQTPQMLSPQEQQQHTQPQFHPQQPQGFTQQPQKFHPQQPQQPHQEQRNGQHGGQFPP